MNQSCKLATFLFLSSCLESCGGGGGGGSLVNINENSRTSKIIREFQIQDTNSNWFDAKWAYQDKTTSPIVENQPFPNKTDQDTFLTKVMILNPLAETPKNIILSKTDGSSFEEKVDALSISENNTLTVQGTNDSTFTINTLDVRGEMNVKSGLVTVTANATIGESGALKGNIIFAKDDSSTSQTRTIDVSGNFNGNLEISKGFMLRSSAGGKITGNLINNQNILLTPGKTLRVDGEFTNSGDILIDLDILSSDSTAPLLDVQGQIDIKSNQDIKLIGGANNSTYDYTILKSASKIIGDGLNLPDGAKKTISSTIYKISGTVTKASSYKSAQRGFANISNMQGRYSKMYTSGQGFMMDKQHISNHLTLTSRQDNNNTFCAVSYRDVFGLYAQYQDSNNLDVGSFMQTSVGEFKLKNSVFMGSYLKSDSDIKMNANNHFFGMSSDFSKTFDVGGFKLSPKMMTSYNKMLSVNGKLISDKHLFKFQNGNHGAWKGGLGIDASSKLSVKSIPIEIFASYNAQRTTGHDLRLISGSILIQEESGFKSESSFGIKVSFAPHSTFFVHAKVTSQDRDFEVGMDIKI